MESYILMGICLACWIGTVAIFRFLMDDRDLSFIVGSVAGLVVAAAAGGAYFAYLSTW